tara:strand:+ start:367 stop:570 length:204 start_codon:yes stop_codon:yes gene_type:complete
MTVLLISCSFTLCRLGDSIDTEVSGVATLPFPFPFVVVVEWEVEMEELFEDEENGRGERAEKVWVCD